MSRWLVLVLAAACGGDGQRCGAGAVAVDGVCVPATDAGLACGSGTVADPATGTCVVDPSQCGSGTVLVGAQCQPIAPHVDVEEGPEPNGWSAAATTPAGAIPVPAADDPIGVVVHGCIVPVNDAPDWDVYTITVDHPTQIGIAIAGVGGLQGAVVAAAPAIPRLAQWERRRLALADGAQGRIYLPMAGTYALGITDARTALDALVSFGASAADDGIAAGNPDGSSCYDATITQITPAPIALAPGTVGGSLGDTPVFYAFSPATVPTAFSVFAVDVPAFDDFSAPITAEAEVSASDADGLRVLSDDTFGFPDPDPIEVGGVADGGGLLVVVDEAFDRGVTSPDYTLTTAVTDAVLLPRDGSTITATSRAQVAQFDENYFAFDVVAADEIDGLAISSSAPVGGAILDRDGVHVAEFGGGGNPLGDPGDGTTFTSYTGLLRFPSPGRYYFALNAPSTPVGGTFDITATLTALPPPAPLVIGTPLQAQPLDAFGAAVYTLDFTGQRWSEFTATGTDTGDLSLALVDPSSSRSYGRLDPLATVGTFLGDSSPFTEFPDAFPFDTLTLSDVPLGYIPGGVPSPALAIVRGASPGPAASFSLDLEPRAGVTDLGTYTVGDDVTFTGESAGSDQPHRYVVSAHDNEFVSVRLSAFTDSIALIGVAGTGVEQPPDVEFAVDRGGFAAGSGLAGGNDTFAFEVQADSTRPLSYSIEVVTVVDHCAAGEFDCIGSCIPADEVCDGFIDCPFGDDEVDCP